MKKKSGLFFISAVLLLIVSEYFFLWELYGTGRWFMLVITSVGLIAGISIIISVIRKYNS